MAYISWYGKVGEQVNVKKECFFDSGRGTWRHLLLLYALDMLANALSIPTVET